MTHQADKVTDAVQDRHVEQIILSGSPFVSSILGPDAYHISAATVPLFYGAPIVVGSVVELSVLLCSEGAFHSSPRAVATYQWKKDTIDIPGETSNMYATVIGDIGSEITCLVTATNASGNDSLISNGITMEALVASSVFTVDWSVIQGLSTPIQAQQMTLDAMIMQGLAVEGQIAVEEQCAFIINGMGDPDSQTHFEAESYVMTGLPCLPAQSHMELGAYVMEMVTSLTPLVVVNGDAENSVMTDWTMDTGTVTSVTTATDHNAGNREGLRFFMPADLGQGVDSQMSQVILIPAGDFTDVDTGLCYCFANFLHQSKQEYDILVITLEALNAADGVLNTAVATMPASPANEGWMRDQTLDDKLSLPTLTRKVKITVLFKAHDTLGSTANSVYADDIQIELIKIL